MRLTVEERVFILESYLKTMPYVHCRQSFVEKFGKQKPVESAIARMIKKEHGEMCMDIISSTYCKFSLVV
jgi:hypothetical protein